MKRGVLMKMLAMISITVLLSACTTGKPAATAEARKAGIGTFGIDTAQMDTSVKPGDDFYKYVNGKWVSTFKMPDDRARYGIFDELREKSENDVRTLVDELAKTPAAA